MAVVYWIAQFLGAIVAAYALKALFPGEHRRRRRGSAASRSRPTSRCVQAIVARGDRDVLPRVRRVRHGGRSAGAEGRRLRDRADGHGGHPGDRPAHRRLDESGAVVRPGGRDATSSRDRPPTGSARSSAAIAAALLYDKLVHAARSRSRRITATVEPARERRRATLSSAHGRRCRSVALRARASRRSASCRRTSRTTICRSRISSGGSSACTRRRRRRARGDHRGPEERRAARRSACAGARERGAAARAPATPSASRRRAQRLVCAHELDAPRRALGGAARPRRRRRDVGHEDRSDAGRRCRRRCHRHRAHAR